MLTCLHCGLVQKQFNDVILESFGSPNHSYFFLVIFMVKMIPTMQAVGWVNDLSNTADAILAAFLTTNTSMSVLHRLQNTSMQYILKETAGNMLNLEDRLQTALMEKLQPEFGQNATAVVTVDPLAGKPDQFNIRFTGTVYDENGKAYSVGKLVKFQDSKIVNIAELNNNGSEQ